MSDHLTLRPMTLDDVDAVAELDRQAFGEGGWSRRYFVGELTESNISLLYVLTDSSPSADALAGYFVVWHVVDQLHLCSFAVDPERHGQGLGALLLECVLRLARRLECSVVQLEVRESNQAARRLYGNRGFVEEAVRQNLYSKPREDGILMSMPAPDASPTPSLPPRTAERWPGGLHLHWRDRGGSLDEHGDEHWTAPAGSRTVS